jgi:HSP20 family protein
MKSLIPWRERNGGALAQLHNEMDNLFHRFIGEPLEEFGQTMKTWTPRVDIEETDKEILVKVDLPGVEPKDVDISVAEGSLIVKGEKKEEREDKKKNYHKIERFVGQFYRELPLPPAADPERITAAGAKGVITVIIPKKATAQPKKIAVKASEG